MYNVIGTEKGTNNTIIIEPNMTEAQAMKMCESWGWMYDDGAKSYYMDYVEVEEKEEQSIKEEETMEYTPTREEVIEKAKEMGITKRELGFCDEYYTIYHNLLSLTKKLIKECEIDPEDARNVFPEDAWSDLDIEDKRYNIVRVKVQKTIYKTVDVVVRGDENGSDVWDYIDVDDADEWDPIEEDEDNWDDYDREIIRYDLTKDEAENYDTVNDIDDLD